MPSTQAMHCDEDKLRVWDRGAGCKDAWTGAGGCSGGQGRTKPRRRQAV